jgi:indolepyruvate ferredoxin oxidoreductase beta subunit
MKNQKKQDVGVFNILFCGTGGQGVLTASEICGVAALYDGYHVKKSEVHGMAQRGGSVESHLRFGKKVFSPLIPKGHAGYLVPFYKDEHGRMIDFLSKGGVDLLKDLEHAHRMLKDRKYVNTFMLGVLSRYLPIKEESWLHALNVVLSYKNIEQNKKIFLKARKGEIHDLE